MKKLIGSQLCVIAFVWLVYIVSRSLGISQFNAVTVTTYFLALVGLGVLAASFYAEQRVVCAPRVSMFVALSAALAACAASFMMLCVVALTTTYGAVFSFERLTSADIQLARWKVTTAIIVEWGLVFFVLFLI